MLDFVSPLFTYVVTDLFFREAIGGRGATSKMQLFARGAPSERPTTALPGARRSQDHILPKRQPWRLYLDNKTLLRIFQMSFLESATVITAGDQNKSSFIIIFIKTNSRSEKGFASSHLY